MDHPVLVETFDFLGDQSVPEAELCAPRINHALSSRAARRFSLGEAVDG
jgi:hypothetical protein